MPKSQELISLLSREISNIVTYRNYSRSANDPRPASEFETDTLPRLKYDFGDTDSKNSCFCSLLCVNVNRQNNVFFVANYVKMLQVSLYTIMLWCCGFVRWVLLLDRIQSLQGSVIVRLIDNHDVITGRSCTAYHDRSQQRRILEWSA
jgi:hypothetical protein